MTSAFHPAVRAWFEGRFPDGPTPAQEQGWPHIVARQNTLIAAPTGSGKTLSGFLIAIDRLYRAFERGEAVAGSTRVVYVSPLKALAVDIQQNLETPLHEIAAIAANMGLEPAPLSVQVRTGDTPAGVRAQMLRHPPNFLVTTPESLYLLLTAERSRALLSAVDTVIVDEIHALARDKRGAHLAFTLERLEHICQGRLVRVGLSATQHPIETVARLLVGAGPDREAPDGRPRCAIVDVGHRRALDLAIELPDDELGAVASKEQMGDVIERIASHVTEHRTTLVFVNTRRMSERVAHQLAERLGDSAVAAHHGSLSKERRTLVEARLRAGELRALVATASLELGIDIGPVNLVCQVGSPRSLATFLQRVGRSGHHLGGTPKAYLYPTTRDELVECCALLAGVRAGRLDAILPPVAPLDILAQQIVAECAAESWGEEELFRLVGRAAPFSALPRERFDEVVELLSEGIPTGRGRLGAYLHRDLVNHQLRGRRGARLAALTSGGAIPESGDYRVLAEPDDTLVGTVNEDWAIESMAGDIFLLGSTSWRITRVASGTVRVADAQGAPPSVPFWLGEAPGRTRELSEEVSQLRSRLDQLLGEGNADEAVSYVESHCGVTNLVAAAVVQYLAAGRTGLGHLPTLEHIVLERFFDESGGMQVVLHAPFGARLNRALGLALRKRFCATFDFELQAAASDDAVLLSLGPQHSFPLADLPHFLSSRTVEEVLTRAALLAPMFLVRWRWNLNRSLTVLRFKGGRKNPPPIQRMEADDVMAAIFPALVACQNENPTGPIEIPDHPLVRQTMYDCLHEVMDVEGLRELVASIEAGRVRVSCQDTTEPSVLAHEIVNGRPYTFLDDAPLEERRSRAVALRRGLPVDPQNLGTLDPEAIRRVRLEAAPDPRDEDELHDLLLSLVVARPVSGWGPWFAGLVEAGRALALEGGVPQLWCAVENRRRAEALFPEARFQPDLYPPAGSASALPPDPGAVAADAVRGHLEQMGPVTLEEIVERTTLPQNLVRIALAQLEGEGFALRGSFDSGPGTEQWCARRLLVRIHGYTQQRLRREIEPVSAQDFMRFLLRWQRLEPGSQRAGRAGLAATIAQLQGLEIPVASWEADILARRVAGYQASWLDQLCSSGEVTWGRLRVRDGGASEAAGHGSGYPSRITPVTLALRADLPWLLQAVRAEATPALPAEGATGEVVDALREFGALFPSDISVRTGRLPTEVEAALWDAVGRGLVTADGFAAARTMLSSAHARSRHERTGLRPSGPQLGGGGRWGMVQAAGTPVDPDALAESLAEQLLVRWGVVFRDLMARETFSLPWRDVLWALRRMEARGTARGGRFVTGFAGEQYALPEAVDVLRSVRRSERTGATLRISAADPLNLAGVILPGPRTPAIRANTVLLRDGLPLDPPDSLRQPGRVSSELTA
ncbi:MAG TPA: DEAD/DEAH box helicase [Candidatus Dormibacteraeota bacterium]|nr:DEAD/DEAH box helicase [Candidatus Dormibacteraeota bacterium]